MTGSRPTPSKRRIEHGKVIWDEGGGKDKDKRRMYTVKKRKRETIRACHAVGDNGEQEEEEEEDYCYWTAWTGLGGEDQRPGEAVTSLAE